MNNIIYKAKLLSFDKWTRGYINICLTGASIFYSDKEEIRTFGAVDLKTLCRMLSGTKDVNGNDVFENDKLICDDGAEYIVKYNECKQAFVLVNRSNNSEYYFENLYTPQRFKIVGNIYD